MLHEENDLTINYLGVLSFFFPTQGKGEKFLFSLLCCVENELR